MKLSIITVNLNNRDGLQKTIDSVVSQTFHDFEWIVIDGGSTDGSKELIEQYADHFAYWVSEPDKGIYNAMNKGVKKSKGEYLFYLNSGDALIEKHILSDVFSNNPSEDILYGDIVYDYPDKRWVYKIQHTITARYFISGDTIPHSGGAFIKRSVISEYGPFDESLKITADWKLFLKAIVFGRATTKHLGITLSIFDTQGISTTHTALAKQEHRAVVSELFSPAILADYDQLFKIEKENLTLKNNAYNINNLISLPITTMLKVISLKIKKRFRVS